jgi:two-component system phosphate regulon sensor histidine kinase PhoR
MRLKISFQGWILLGSFFVVLCTLIFVSIILQGSLRNQLVQNIQASLSQELSLVEEVVKDRWRENASLSENDKLANQIGRSLSLRVTLIRPDGVVIGDSHVKPDELERLENHANRPEVLAAMKQGQGESIRHSTTVGADLLYMAHVLRLPGRPPLVVRLAMPLSEVDHTLAHTRRLIWGAILLGIVLSFGVAYLVARSISKPVKELTKTAASIAGGDLSRRLTRYPSHEVGELGRAFDSMADSLQEQIEAVTRARDRLEAVLKGMVEGVLLIDQNNQVILANRALKEMLGLSADPSGQAASDVIRNADLLALINQARQGKPLVFGQMRTLGPPKRYLEVSVVNLDKSELGAGRVVVLHDITELKRTEEVRRDFVANVSHELRTPLAAIRGSVETLLDGALDSPEDARRFAEMISRQVVRLQRIVQDLLDLAALESGSLESQLEDVPAGPFCETLVGMVEDMAQVQGVKLSCQLPEENLVFRADRRRLEQAVLNLLDNAVKYTDAGGSVTLSVKKELGQVSITVSDTGLGIAAEHLPRLFERFYRVDKNRSREMGGTGLGLSIVKHLAQSQGGQVEVQSQPGKGSNFRLILPDSKL